MVRAGRTVAVLASPVAGWLSGEVVQGVEEVLRAARCDLLLYRLDDERATRGSVLGTDLLATRVDGVVVIGLCLTAEERSRLTELGRPVVTVGQVADGLPGVSIDDRAAGRIATEHLVGLGHTRIGYVGGTADACGDSAPSAHLAGYRSALRALAVGHDPRLEEIGEVTVVGGAEAGRRLLGRPDWPTAVVAASDEMATGVLVAARELGFTVPGDLSVVGADDHDLAGFFDLTTVARPAREQGRRGAERLLTELEGGRPGGSEVLGVELLVRASSGPPHRSQV